MEKFNYEAYDYKRSLIVSGPVGVGKTYNCEELLARYEGKNKESEVLWRYKITDSAFKEHVASGTLKLLPPEERVFGSNIKKYPLEMMIRAEVLLFDDLGVADTSEAYIRKLTFVLDNRMEKGLITIFTTNLMKDEIEAKFNKRLTSRIFFNADVVIMKGKDRRGETTRTFKS